VIRSDFHANLGEQVPFPKTVTQGDPQRVLYKANLYALSPYPIASQGVKVMPRPFKTLYSRQQLSRYVTTFSFSFKEALLLRTSCASCDCTCMHCRPTQLPARASRCARSGAEPLVSKHSPTA